MAMIAPDPKCEPVDGDEELSEEPPPDELREGEPLDDEWLDEEDDDEWLLEDECPPE